MKITSTILWIALGTIAIHLDYGCSSADVPVVDETGRQSERHGNPPDGGPDSASGPATGTPGETGNACTPTPVTTADMPIGMAESLCPDGRTDCLRCLQCTDPQGNAVEYYVVGPYPSTCPCPYAPTICPFLLDAGTAH